MQFVAPMPMVVHPHPNLFMMHPQYVRGCPVPAVSPPRESPSAGELFEKRRKTKVWTLEEDQRLLAAIDKYGTENWKLIAKMVGNGRNRSQCSQRWLRGLKPTLRKEPWSSDEDERLLGAVRKYGARGWTKIGEVVGNRCDVQCRYRFLQLQRMGAVDSDGNSLGSGIAKKDALPSIWEIMAHDARPKGVSGELNSETDRR